LFTKKTVHDIDLHDKRVLLRADYNVPVDENGQITDDYRIKQSLLTIKYLLEQNLKLVICSHLGRPDGKPDPKMSLEPVAKRLGELLKKDVAFVHDCIGSEVEAAAGQLQSGQILMLENLRFHPEEEANNDEFAQQLAKLADIFVEDGFGVVHRAHASTEAITHHLPSVAGLLLEKEVDTITNVMENPTRPLMAIIGGAKIADKIDILNKFIEIADFVVIGGAMANTFLMAEGIPIAKSKVETEDVPIAKEVIAKAQAKDTDHRVVFYIPQDGVVASSVDKMAHTRIIDWSTHAFSDIENYPKQPPEDERHIKDDEMILDIGPFSGAFIAGGIQLSNTVVWNGTMGVTETASLHGPIGPFAHGTELVIEAMLGQFGHRPFSLIGGGDTAGYIQERGLVESFDHVSTGGGASLELMAGRILPGVAALLDKDQPDSNQEAA
jgi:3-phosphoglycerate kinase